MNIPKYDLTSTGFHYVLLDTPTQVHIILRKYIEYIQNKFKDLNNSFITIELIKVISDNKGEVSWRTILHPYFRISYFGVSIFRKEMPC
jgi:hypothetical protein